MNRFWSLSAAALVLLAGAVGCEKATVEGPAGKKLTLVKPVDQTIKRGENNGVLITITRENFRDAVNVHFENLPQGVIVQDKDMKIGTGDTLATFTLKADDNAALVTNHEVTVTVTGPDNMKASEKFRLTVKDKS